MKQVETVCGTIDVTQIGGALVHEHVLASAPGIPENYPQLYGKDYYERAKNALLALSDGGVNTVCDASTYDLGRDPRRLKLLSQDTGIHIICTTGIFQSLDHAFGNFTEEQLTELYIDDITKGMAGTDIKAGLIKAVMDRECCTPGRIMQHHAAAVASSVTCCPIFLHSASELETGRHQLRLLKEAGARMDRVRIDHILDTTNMEYIRWLYDQGVWLGVDRLPRIRFASEYFVSTEQRLRTVKAMIDEGMADRMLFGHDAGAVSTLWDTVDQETLDFVHNQVIPDGWLFIQKHAFPRLIELGVDADVLHTILFSNPRRYFENA